VQLDLTVEFVAKRRHLPRVRITRAAGKLTRALQSSARAARFALQPHIPRNLREKALYNRAYKDRWTSTPA